MNAEESRAIFERIAFMHSPAPVTVSKSPASSTWVAQRKRSDLLSDASSFGYGPTMAAALQALWDKEHG